MVILMVTSDNHPVISSVSQRTYFSKWVRRETMIGWLFVVPALLMYAVFVLLPLLLTIVYSFYKWNGVGPMTWVGLKNYATVFEVPDLLGTIVNAFWLVIWFSFIPVTLGLRERQGAGHFASALANGVPPPTLSRGLRKCAN